MATEEGVIIKVYETTALVKTRRMTACESCAEKNSCHSGGGGNKSMEVEAVNTVNAQMGDRVVVYFESRQLFKLSFLLYVFPVIVMIVGALIGERVAENFHGNPSAYSAFFGFAFFFVAMAVVKLIDKKARKTGKYRPQIVRIKKKAGIGDAELPPASCRSDAGE